MFSSGHVNTRSIVVFNGAWGIKDGWILVKFIFIYFFIFFFIRDGVEVHKDPKKERDQYPAILTEQYWLIKDLLYGFGQFFLAGQST